MNKISKCFEGECSQKQEGGVVNGKLAYDLTDITLEFNN